MSSSVVQRYNFLVAGEPIAFANPFAVLSTSLDNPPSVYTVSVAADSTAVLWNGLPLPSTFDVFAVVSDQNIDCEFTVDSGASKFTLFVPAGGFPLVLQGDDSYQSGNLAGTLGVITEVRAKNRNTTTLANVQVLIAKAAA